MIGNKNFSRRMNGDNRIKTIHARKDIGWYESSSSYSTSTLCFFGLLFPKKDHDDLEGRIVFAVFIGLSFGALNNFGIINFGALGLLGEDPLVFTVLVMNPDGDLCVVVCRTVPSRFTDLDLVKFPVFTVVEDRVRDPPVLFVDFLIVPALCFFLGLYFVAIFYQLRMLSI